MTGVIISFPGKPRRQWPETVEVEACTDPATGRTVFVFEVIAADGHRAGIGMRTDLDQARDDIAWLRRGGVPVREIGSLFFQGGSQQ